MPTNTGTNPIGRWLSHTVKVSVMHSIYGEVYMYTQEILCLIGN